MGIEGSERRSAQASDLCQAGPAAVRPPSQPSAKPDRNDGEIGAKHHMSKVEWHGNWSGVLGSPSGCSSAGRTRLCPMTYSSNQPTVVFVHGVGVSPLLFGDLSDAWPGPSAVVVRPGYDDTMPARDWDDQVDWLLAATEPFDDCVLVGVSGGATLALAALLRQPAHVRLVVAHEPLVGVHEPVLQQRVQTAAQRLAIDPMHAMSYLPGLYGHDVWDSLPQWAQEWGRVHVDAIANDVAQLATFSLDLDAFGAVADRFVATVGDWSPVERHRVQALLINNGSNGRVVQSASHLVQVEAPTNYSIVLGQVLPAVFA